jgi:hypothetical protein
LCSCAVSWSINVFFPYAASKASLFCDNMVGTYALLDFLGGVDGMGSKLCANLWTTQFSCVGRHGE